MLNAGSAVRGLVQLSGGPAVLRKKSSVVCYRLQSKFRGQILGIANMLS